MHSEKILILGAGGQIGTELTHKLREISGIDNVIATDIRDAPSLRESGIFEIIDVMQTADIASLIDRHQVTQIYHLAALLSASGEKNPKLAWKINMDGLTSVLDLAVEKKINKIFWPSSIAVFGPTTPRVNTPQDCVMVPTTMYGVTKLSGELLVSYYFKKFGLDIRSLRYPGLLSWKTPPGGGTTDYAIEIFHEAIRNNSYTSFLNEGTRLPMMYMDDAIRATIELMEVDASKIKARTSYNITAMSFTPAEIAEEIRKHISSFTIDYRPDFRQQIADSWPKSIDDSSARKDWGWKPEFDLSSMVKVMLENIAELAKAN